jgi:hypothetical protein
MASDYYNILEVPHTASVETIKKAYYRLALRDHPDKNNGTENATERFKAVCGLLLFMLNYALLRRDVLSDCGNGC